MLLPERLEGAIYGHLVGDALGVPYEFTPAHRIGAVEWRGHGTYDQLLGTWSDDGALMLALLDSLLTRRFDTADQAQRALDWKDHGAHAPGGLVFDIGDSTAQALAQLRLGTTPEQAGAASAKGNGSLMRILPVAPVLRDLDDDALVAGAVRASRVTHGSAEAQVACALYTLVVRRLLQGKTDRPSVLDDARRALRIVLQERGLPGSKEAGSPPEAVAALDAFEAWSGREGRGRVVDCFWSAWDAFAGADDYVAAITRAVKYDTDTDTTTTTAIVGGLAGLCWGIGSIPSAWHRGCATVTSPRSRWTRSSRPTTRSGRAPRGGHRLAVRSEWTGPSRSSTYAPGPELPKPALAPRLALHLHAVSTPGPSALHVASPSWQATTPSPCLQARKQQESRTMQIRSPRSVLAVSAALALTAAAMVPLSAFAKGPGPGPGAGSFGAASGAAQRGRAEDRPRGPEACAECQYEMGTLTEAQMAAVQYMANEEKLAHDVYTRFAELYDVPVFERIASAEAQHETAVDFIVERYEIVDSPRGLDLGVFTNDEISALYATLVVQGSEDLEGALAAGVLVEKTDIGDLKAAMRGLEEAAPDAYHVFSNLLAGSERHLVTFQSYR